MLYDVTVMPRKQKIEAAAGENLLKVLRAAGFFVNAVCGGNGSCGKCKVWIDGQETRACRTIIDRDMTVVLSPEEALHILTDSIKITTGFSSKEVFTWLLILALLRWSAICWMERASRHWLVKAH